MLKQENSLLEPVSGNKNCLKLVELHGLANDSFRYGLRKIISGILFIVFQQFFNLTVVSLFNFLTLTHIKMLNYVKTVLTKVSFDALLFEKELRKAIKLLIADEISDLRNWCYTRFGKEHEAILNRCFVPA